jgi:hypothetical protein
MFWWRWWRRRGGSDACVQCEECPIRPEKLGTDRPLRNRERLNQPFKYLLKKSSVRCQDNLAAGSS